MAAIADKPAPPIANSRKLNPLWKKRQHRTAAVKIIGSHLDEHCIICDILIFHHALYIEKPKHFYDSRVTYKNSHDQEIFCLIKGTTMRDMTLHFWMKIAHFFRDNFQNLAASLDSIRHVFGIILA